MVNHWGQDIAGVGFIDERHISKSYMTRLLTREDGLWPALFTQALNVSSKEEGEG